MKKIIKNIIYAILGILMIIAFIYLGTKDYEEKTVVLKDNEIMHNNFNLVPLDNNYKILKNTEVPKFINNNTGVILFCMKESKWCNYYAYLVHEASKELSIETVYYFDILTDRQENSYYYQKVITATKDYLPKNDLGDYIVNVPDIYIIKNGIILGHNNETSWTYGNVTPDEYWTLEKQEEFINALKETFSKLEN